MPYLYLVNVSVTVVQIHIDCFNFQSVLDPRLIHIETPTCHKISMLYNYTSPYEWPFSSKSLRKSCTRSLFEFIFFSLHTHFTSFVISLFWQRGSFSRLRKQYLLKNDSWLFTGFFYSMYFILHFPFSVHTLNCFLLKRILCIWISSNSRAKPDNWIRLNESWIFTLLKTIFIHWRYVFEIGIYCSNILWNFAFLNRTPYSNQKIALIRIFLAIFS